MLARFAGSCVAASLMLSLIGCSSGSAIGIAKNLGSNRLDIDVFIDGQKAEKNMLKQAAMGHSNYKIKERISTRPKLRVELKKPEDTGRVKEVIVNIFREHKSGYSSQADWVVIGDPVKMMPGTEYDLGAGSGLKIYDFNNNPASGVTLQNGMKYQFNVVVVADQSETAAVFVETQ